MLVRNIVYGALRKIGVVAVDSDATADEAAAALESFNDMMHAWKLDSIDVLHTDLALNDTFPLAPEFQEGTKFLLASRISHDFMAPATFDPDEFLRKIQAAYCVIEPMVLDPILTNFGRRSYAGY